LFPKSNLISIKRKKIKQLTYQVELTLVSD
jgi:hypothetical protein